MASAGILGRDVALFRGPMERSQLSAYFLVGLADEIGHKSADFARLAEPVPANFTGNLIPIELMRVLPDFIGFHIHD
jgi:hypothetical protein